MPDPFAPADQQDDEFFRGLNFLGRPSSITLPGQEPTSPGGLAAGGPTPSAPSPTGAPADTGGMMGSGGGSSGLNALMTALSFANRGSNVLDLVSQGFGAATGGAVQTPSGQLTTGAPEILRGLQFPSGELSMAEQALATQAEQGGDIAAEAASNLGLGSYLGPVLGAAPSILSIIQALQRGDAAGIINPLGQLGTLGASFFDLIPTAASVAGETAGTTAGAISGGLAGAGGAAIPIGAWTTILTNIITDMINDPRGQMSSAQDYNYLMGNLVGREAGTLGLAASALPLINNSLTNEQALQLYDIVRLGVEAPGQMADPLAHQGQRSYGVRYQDYPGATAFSQQEGPVAWQALRRLEDLMAQRGIEPPTVEGALGRMEPWQIAWQLGELTKPSIETTEGYDVPAGAWYGRPASETAFLEPLGPIDFAQGPFSGYGLGGAPAGSPFTPAASAPGMAADALPAMMGSGTVFPWENA